MVIVIVTVMAFLVLALPTSGAAADMLHLKNPFALFLIEAHSWMLPAPLLCIIHALPH